MDFRKKPNSNSYGFSKHFRSQFREDHYILTWITLKICLLKKMFVFFTSIGLFNIPICKYLSCCISRQKATYL